jgi:hypothetical protein
MTWLLIERSKSYTLLMRAEPSKQRRKEEASYADDLRQAMQRDRSTDLFQTVVRLPPGAATLPFFRSTKDSRS